MTRPVLPPAPEGVRVTGLAVSVVIPVANGGPALERCLAGVAALRPRPYEVIVVDDGSTDGSGERAAASGARVLRLSQRSGPAAARNAGWRAAAGDVVLFLDADVVVRPEAVARVARTLADPSLSGVIGSYDDAPAAPGLLSQYKNLAHRFVHQTSGRDTFSFWGACGALRRSALAETGGFDERYREPSVEDIELGYRLRRAGHRVRLDPDLEVTHLKAWTLRHLIETDVRRRAIPWSELLCREGLDDDLNLKTRARAAVLLAWAAVLSAAAAAIDARAAWVAACGLALLVLLDAPLWAYFARLRGPLFALAVVPVHLLHYLYSGGAFVWVCARRLWISRRTPRVSEAA